MTTAERILGVLQAVGGPVAPADLWPLFGERETRDGIWALREKGLVAFDIGWRVYAVPPAAS